MFTDTRWPSRTLGPSALECPTYVHHYLVAITCPQALRNLTDVQRSFFLTGEAFASPHLWKRQVLPYLSPASDLAKPAPHLCPSIILCHRPLAIDLHPCKASDRVALPSPSPLVPHL